MNLVITDFQVKVLLVLLKEQGKTTYEIQRELKVKHSKVRSNLDTLYRKAFVAYRKGHWYAEGEFNVIPSAAETPGYGVEQFSWDPSY